MECCQCQIAVLRSEHTCWLEGSAAQHLTDLFEIRAEFYLHKKLVSSHCIAQIHTINRLLNSQQNLFHFNSLTQNNLTFFLLFLKVEYVFAL